MHAPATDRQAPRVLLVDDDAESLVLLRAALEGEGIDVVGMGRDGSEVDALAEQADPDVVLMDLRMPGMDGFEATRSIKAGRPWVQVIFLTFYEQMLPERDPEEVGAFAYLVKGCSIQVMRDVINEAWRHALEERWMKAYGT